MYGWVDGWKERGNKLCGCWIRCDWRDIYRYIKIGMCVFQGFLFRFLAGG